VTIFVAYTPQRVQGNQGMVRVVPQSHSIITSTRPRQDHPIPVHQVPSVEIKFKTPF